MRRPLIDVLVVVLLLGLALGIWWWGGHQRDKALAEQQASYETQLTSLRADSETWATKLSHSEARAAFRAFIAGVGPAVLGARNESVDLALVSLLDVPAIDFAHLMRPDGTVIASSDRKLTTAGTAGERAGWALAASEIITRDGATQGVSELAAPIPGPDGPVAFVWIGYRADQVKEELRPAGLKAS